MFSVGLNDGQTKRRLSTLRTLKMIMAIKKIKKPRLFGIKHSNRDFSKKESWGKNQFNSSFPVALACYMNEKEFENIYLKLDKNLKVIHDKITSESLFGICPKSDDLFFAFETPYTPYQQLLIGNIPRTDIVIQNSISGNCLRGLEIKLTALPDNVTCDLPENQYGCELVIRPDTIVYLACSIAMQYKNKRERKKLTTYIDNKFEGISDWTEPNEVLPYVSEMVKVIEKITQDKILSQEPLIIQPVWKTLGKSPILAHDCLEVFVWSNLAFTRLFLDMATEPITQINRSIRTIIWFFKMLYDFSVMGQIDYRCIIDKLSFNTKNDKAFATNGKITHSYMQSQFLTQPRILKSEIKNIILDGGQNLLSPERRFDAIIYNSPNLF